MNTASRRLLGGLATAVLLSLGQAGIMLAASPSPAAAPSGPTGDEMLSVQPSLLSVAAKPGTTTSTRLTLRSAAALDITIKSQGLSQATDGNFNAVPENLDTTTYSARTMISAAPETLRLRAGDKVDITVDIAVPTDAGAGTRYGILAITGLPAGAAPSSNVGFGVQLGVSTIVQIADTAQTKTGEIKDIAIGTPLPGQPLPITVSFLNTGTTHYGALPNELVTTSTLQDASGALLASASANGTQLSVIPTFFRDVALNMTPSSALVADASYRLEVGVGLKDGTVFDRKAMEFTWSGGGVLNATGAPIQAAPESPTQSSDLMIVIIAAVLGALSAVLLIWAVSRRRRRQGTVDGATTS